MKKSIYRICRICSKSIKPRGMGGHMSLAHGIREKEVIKYVVDPSGDSDASKKLSSQNGYEKLFIDSPEILEEPIIADTSKEDVLEIVEFTSQSEPNFYTDTDVKILLARIINYIYQTDQPSQLLQQFAKMDMIEDFEKRFRCDFKKVKKENQHITFGKTEPEHLEFANKYAHLKYSR